MCKASASPADLANSLPQLLAFLCGRRGLGLTQQWSGLSPGRLRGIIWGLGDQTQARHMKEKCPHCCTLSSPHCLLSYVGDSLS